MPHDFDDFDVLNYMKNTHCIWLTKVCRESYCSVTLLGSCLSLLLYLSLTLYKNQSPLLFCKGVHVLERSVYLSIVTTCVNAESGGWRRGRWSWWTWSGSWRGDKSTFRSGWERSRTGVPLSLSFHVYLLFSVHHVTQWNIWCVGIKYFSIIGRLMC